MPIANVTGMNTPPPIQIDYEDVADENVFWESAVICYVMGANPPLHVIDGFVRRIWNAESIDKIGLVGKGVFLVRMKTIEAMIAACGSSGMLFDKKPFIVKPWTKNASFEKETLNSIPIWVCFPGLGKHYWGERCLRKIAEMLGSVVQIDSATLNKDRLLFARVLIEMKLDGGFPETLAFTNEDNELVTFPVTYDWKPIVCDKCKQISHTREQCKMGIIRQWVPKVTVATANTIMETTVDKVTTATTGDTDNSAFARIDHAFETMLGKQSTSAISDPGCEEGFLVVRGRSRSRYEVGEGSRPAVAILLSTSNGFEVLSEHDTHPSQALGAISHPTNE